MQHRIVVWTLIGVASIVCLVGSLTIWVDRQMLDNHAWNRASQQIVQNPEVQTALSYYLVNSLYQNIDVAAALRQRLPKGLEPLAAPAAAALRQPAVNAVELMLQRPRVQGLFINASSIAHQKLVNVLENKTGHGISTGNGKVTLNLSQLIVQLGQELGLSESALARVPPDAGTITIMTSKQLSTAQTAVNTIRVLSAFVLIAVLVLYAVAVYLARGGRRVALRGIGWILIAEGLLLLIVRRVAGNYVTNGLAPPEYRHMTHTVWLISTSILGQLGGALVLYGLVVVAGMLLAGDTRPARAVRRFIAPVLNDHQGYAWGALGFVWLLAILWGGTHALRTWWGILLIGGLLALGLEALRRQTLVEFGPVPEAPAPPGKAVPTA
jgi:hypothetical protein